MKKPLFLFCAILFLFSCEEEVPDLQERSIQYCKDRISFTCVEPLGEFYFKGTLNGTEFCVSYGVEDYWMQNAVGTETVTSTANPNLTPDATPQSSFFGFHFFPPIIDNVNGLSKEFAPSVYIYTPFILDTTVYSAGEYLERFIHQGDLVLRDIYTDKYSGFKFTIAWGCAFLPSYDYYYQKDPSRIPAVGVGLTPSAGKQKDAVFRVTEYTKTVTPDFDIYDITFEIECDLYYGNSSKDRTYFGRLENGVFKTQVVLERGG
jgi:hypothetical protein